MDNNFNFNMSEHFYSIQGEGISNGTPAYFIRLHNCNLNCSFCDSKEIWKLSNQVSFVELVNVWVELDILKDILKGSVHVVFTGGEPLLKFNQTSIINFMNFMEETFPNVKGEHPKKIYYEVETNGTQVLDLEFYKRINQINCSPKLENSENSFEKRVQPLVIEQILSHYNSWIKLVIGQESDLVEYMDLFKSKFGINLPMNNVILMPMLIAQDHYFEMTKLVYEMAKKYRCKAVSRNHVAAWNRLTGV